MAKKALARAEAEKAKAAAERARALEVNKAALEAEKAGEKNSHTLYSRSQRNTPT